MPDKAIDIDDDRVRTYAWLGGTDRDIAERFGVTERQLRRRFGRLLVELRARRRLKLREFQWRQAQEGSVQLLLMLGREELGQGQGAPEPDDRIIIHRMIDRP